VRVALYRFFNMEKSRYGEPFALCEAHAKTQTVPSLCILQQIANDSLIECNQCMGEEFKKLAKSTETVGRDPANSVSGDES